MEAEAQAIKCWNAYIESHDGKEPPSVADFQGWLSTHSHFCRNVSYSKSYDIYDDYSGKGKIEDSGSNTTSPPHNKLPPTIQISQAPCNRNTHYYDKLKRKQQQSVHNKQHYLASETSTTMTPPSPSSFHYQPLSQPNRIRPPSKTPPGTSRTKTHTAFPYHIRKLESDTQVQTTMESDQKQPCINLRGASYPVTVQKQSLTNRRPRTQSENDYIRKRNTPKFNRAQSGPIGKIATAMHIKAVSMAPKVVPDIVLKDDFTLFLIEYDIQDLKSKLTEYQIGLRHLESLEADDLNELCAYLKLSITEKIRFKFAVKDIQQKKYGSAVMQHAGLMQSHSSDYTLAPALLSDDEYANGTNTESNSQKVLHSMQTRSDAVYGPYY